MPYHDQIGRELKNCLTETNLGIGEKRSGKVRDTYALDDKLILITTDRQSAFDRILASVPFKGQILNQTSAWWFEKTSHIIPNHVLSIPDPNVTVAKKCAAFPVEVVVRGYITGTTDTSAWVNYQKGVLNFCGVILPEGLHKNQKFDRPILTPTTKAVQHDRLISPAEIIAEGLMSQSDWDYVSDKASALFTFGQQVARDHGLILVDTKYEFGKDDTGAIRLIDEIHTPDSSRYWIESSYAERLAQGVEPENIDKEFLRLWFKEHCDPYRDPVLPPAPDELVIELSARYIQLYEMITGRLFQFPNITTPIQERIAQNLGRDVQTAGYFSAVGHSHDGRRGNAKPMPMLPDPPIKPTSPSAQQGGSADDRQTITVVLILGSDKDADHGKKITEELNKFGIRSEQHVASAHKQAREALAILDRHKNDRVIYVTVAGRSNALSGFVAGNSDKVTIACPPFSDRIDMLVNIHSTLQMPANVPVMTILEPANVALAVKRMVELQKQQVGAD